MTIQFKYDVPSAGTRVSFVLSGAAMNFNPAWSLDEWLSKATCLDLEKYQMAQTKENLLMLRDMIDYIIEVDDDNRG